MQEGPIAHLPVGERVLERLEDRRRKWNHDDFAPTILLLLDVVEFAEAKGEELAAEVTGHDSGEPAPTS